MTKPCFAIFSVVEVPFIERNDRMKEIILLVSGHHYIEIS